MMNVTDKAVEANSTREAAMVVIERDEQGRPTIWCDPEIVDLVTALNHGGVRTIASCSGHGFRPGSIALDDGRWLIVAKDDAERQKIDAIFPVDINGHNRALTAALPHLSQGVVRVKAIEWGSTSYGRPEAETVLGFYRINEAFSGGWTVTAGKRILPTGDGRSNWPTIDEAKAAAQADYERRIMSAIEVSTSPCVVTDEVDGGWLIHKAGRGWYRPNAQGYTNDTTQAGRYSHEDALSYSHPNGWAGPRDGITIKHESELQPLRTAALSSAGEKEDEARCFICAKPFKAGEMVLTDVTEGLGHRECFGEDRQGYCNFETGEPLGEDEPIPTGWPYEADEPLEASPAPVSEEMVPNEVGLAGFYEAQKPEVKGKPLYDQCVSIYRAMCRAALAAKGGQ